MLTLEKFRATRTKVNDLSSYFGIPNDDGAQRPGYTYAEDCYLVICGHGRQPVYHLGIGSKEWTSPDLAKQEERLYRGWYMLDYTGEAIS